MSTAGRLLLVAVLTLLPLALPSVSTVAAFKYLQVGMNSPRVAGEDLISGEKVSTENKNEGDIVCVAFWASWSPRSMELLADLKKISLRLSDQRLRIIAVNVDSQVVTSAVKERVREIVARLEPPFPVIQDEKLESFYEFGVVAVPSVAILDSDDVLQYSPSGYSYTIRDKLIDAIEVLLGLRSPAEEQASEPRYKPNPKAARYYSLAAQLTNQEAYDTAMANLDRAAAEDSMFPAIYSLRGQIQLEQGETESALESYTRAVSLDSGSVIARAGLGRALLEAGDIKAARAELETALEMDPAFPAVLRDLARCLAAGGEYEQAIAMLEEAISLNPRSLYYYYHLGKTYRQSGQNRKALEAFRSALEIRF